MKKIMLPATAVLLLISCPGEAQLRALEQWTKYEWKDRPDLADESFAKKALSKEKAKKASELLVGDKKLQLDAAYDEQWSNRVLWYQKYKMPFSYKIWGEKPADGRSLWISMHGGGNTPSRVNDQQYRNQQHLYDATMKNLEGVYLAMRAPTNTWDLWHQEHIDELLNIIIQLAAVYEDVNPNKVYILGYSAGGDGVYQLAPRWAAASMMAGHPNDASPLNLRNTPFSIHVGALDSFYKRNEQAARWKAELRKLQAQNPGAYEHWVEIPEGRGHWMMFDDAAALPWMAKYRRNPMPEKIVWRQDNVLHYQFYWLEVPEGVAKEGGVIRAEYSREKNEINITENYAETLILNLNDDMLDLDKPVVVKHQGEPIYRGKVKRTVLSIWASLRYRGDKTMVFTASLTVLDNARVMDGRE